VWSDEFDYTGPPDPARWTLEQGFLRNEEAQYYVHDRPQNARVENGVLVIEAHRERFPNPRFDPKAKNDWTRERSHAEYTSASVTTSGKAQWTYGRFEVRAKLPTARGTWPAIWMLGENIHRAGWPRCGEIDIMEFVGYDTETVHFNVHTEAYNHNKKNNKSALRRVPKLTDDFHVYSAEWDPQKIVVFFDGEPVLTYENDGTGVDSWPFFEPQYLLLNLAIGGGWGGLHGIDETAFPQRFVVDYVRVYERER
jgi:beta-glucanase (GH16 family)